MKFTGMACLMKRKRPCLGFALDFTGAPIFLYIINGPKEIMLEFYGWAINTSIVL